MASYLVSRGASLFDVYDGDEKVAGPLPKEQASTVSSRYDAEVVAATGRSESNRDYQRSITLSQHERHDAALAGVRKVLSRFFDAAVVEAKMKHIKPIVVANRDTMRRDRKAFAKARSRPPQSAAAN